MEIPFCGPTYQGRSAAINSSRCINFYPELTGTSEGKTTVSLIRTPGSNVVLQMLGTTIRGFYSWAGSLWAIVDNHFYKLDLTTGNYILKGTLSTSSGNISITDNGISGTGSIGGDQLMFVDGVAGYVYNNVTDIFQSITQTTGGDIVNSYFPATPKTVSFLNGYITVTDGTQKFVVSDKYNALNYRGLAFAATIAYPDNIQISVNHNQQIVFIKDYSLETWYDTGTSTNDGSPYSPVSGGVADYGTISPWSVARGGSSVFFLATVRTAESGNTFAVVELASYQPQIISTAPIAYLVSQWTNKESVRGYCYSDQGHVFYVLSCDTQTLVYDATTQMWHEWSSVTSTSTSTISTSRHFGAYYAQLNGKHYCSDTSLPHIREVSRSYNTDGFYDIVPIRTAPCIVDKNLMNRSTITKLLVDMDRDLSTSMVTYAPDVVLAGGSHLADGSHHAGMIPSTVTEASSLFLSWSDDNGVTWSNEYEKKMSIGGVKTKVFSWSRLGISRDRIFRLRVNMQAECKITNAYIEGGPNG